MLAPCYNRSAMVSGLFRVAVVACAVIAAGCSLAVDPDQVQCEVAADCAAIGFPDSDCVNAVCAGSIAFRCADEDWPPATGGQVQVSIEAENIGMNAVPDVPIYACPILVDGDCSENALAGPLPTDALGVTKISVEEGFRGHFYVPADEQAQRSKYILTMHPPPVASTPHTLSAGLVITDIATLTAIAGTLDGINVIPGRSLLFFSARNCQGELLSGVTLNVGEGLEEVQAVYLGTNGGPDVSLKATGTAGRGVLINIPAGRLPVSAFFEGEKIFQQPLKFEIDTITSTQIVPSKY